MANSPHCEKSMSTEPAGIVPESDSMGSEHTKSSESSSAPAGALGTLAEGSTISLPPPVVAERRLDNPDRTKRTIRRLDLFFVGANLLLAFLLGSFVARNTDIWMHIAAGRTLLQGVYQFGVDPFSSTMNDVYWVNHAWLFDIAAFGAFQAFGGAGLVVLKALLIVGLAGVLIRLGSKEGSVWISAVFAALALLAISARLALQPICVSYLFLALTLYFLERPLTRASTASSNDGRGVFTAFQDYWPLLILFILWVNLDEWFLLGPITVGLYALGQGLQSMMAPVEGQPRPRQGEAKELIVVFVGGLAACMLNPHHIRAFLPPAQLGWSESAEILRQDPSIRGLFISPFEGLLQSPAAIDVAGWLYFVLVLVGLVSFTLNRAAWHWWRMLIWCAFFLLSAYQSRTIPFFAIVAAPISALNIQEFLANRFARVSSSETPAHPWSLYGRYLTVLILIGLVILAWPGWLQSQPHERRMWAIQPDPSLERAATQIARWRSDGNLAQDALGFNVSPETANYFAWACPEEKGFVDSRLRMPADVAADYLSVRQALLANPKPADESALGDKAAQDWREVLRSRHVNHIIVHDSDPRRISAPVRRLLAAPEEWPLLYLDGRTAVFGWNDPAAPRQNDAFASMRVNTDWLAFHPPMGEEVPRQSSMLEMNPHNWWDAFVQLPEFRPLETDKAAAYLMQLEVQMPRAVKAKRDLWENSLAASAIGLTANSGLVAPNLALTLRITTASISPDGNAGARKNPRATEVDLAATSFWRGVVSYMDAKPMALPLLATRAARRALAVNPADEDACRSLGQAYGMLRDLGGDPNRPEINPLLSMMRHVQIVAALEEALRLNPDLEAVHRALATVYLERQYLDAALEHLRAEQRLVLRAGQRARETADEFAQRTNLLDQRVRELEEAVHNRQNEMAIRAASVTTDPLGRAQLALSFGLTRQALDDVLLKSDVLMFGGTGAQLEITLLLMLGRLREARAKLDDPDLQENKAQLGYFDLPLVNSAGESKTYRFPAYEWLVTCYAAAVGDYDRALAALDAIQEQIRTEGHRTLPFIRRELTRAIALEIALRPEPQTFVLQFLVRDKREQLARAMVQSFFVAEEQADLYVLSGMLALEQGSVDAAARHFEKAITVIDEGPDPGARFAGRPLATAIRKRIRATQIGSRSEP
jgi:tetratricopeptide (TPR) repeat protein